jgi:hypothetical protein
MRPARLRAVLLIAAFATGGCGEEEKLAGSPDPATERSDRPAKPPPGWRTFANRRAGVTVSIPREWVAHARGSASLIRSPDRLVSVTVVADRSKPGREIRPRAYARDAFRALPNFRRLRMGRVRKVPGTRYPSARVDGAGTLARPRQRQPQRITVAAFRRPGRVTFTVVAFAAEVGGAPAHAASVRLLLRSLRGQRPRL